MPNRSIGNDFPLLTLDVKGMIPVFGVMVDQNRGCHTNTIANFHRSLTLDLQQYLQPSHLRTRGDQFTGPGLEFLAALTAERLDLSLDPVAPLVKAFWPQLGPAPQACPA
jgi:hypothetical protein